MGIVNVTPDSFSDGGEYLDPAAAISHGRELVAEGAGILDIGGESTRPGAAAVPAAEELRRVIPVIEGLGDAAARISVDTSKADVAEAAIAAGAGIVNDVTALSDPRMAAVCAEAGVEVILMHMLGTPRTMQDDPRYEDVVIDVRDFLATRVALAVDAGIDERQIWIDPGIGFGKTVAHNLELIRRLGELRELGRPLVLGSSRKRFIGALSGREVDERLGGTIAANAIGYLNGADVLRVHDVKATCDALAVVAAIIGEREWRLAAEAVDGVEAGGVE